MGMYCGSITGLLKGTAQRPSEVDKDKVKQAIAIDMLKIEACDTSCICQACYSLGIFSVWNVVETHHLGWLDLPSLLSNRDLFTEICFAIEN